MGVLTEPANLALAGACVGAYAYAKRRKVRDPFPTELWVDDPPATAEGVFEIGHYLPDVDERCVWAPWDSGEQHLGIFGTTGAGKSVAAKLVSAAAPELWGWETIAMDGAKDGLDFAFMDDSHIGEVVPSEDIGVRLTQIAEEVERRGRALKRIRVKRTDRKGVERAVVPVSLRALSKREREHYGIKPMLVIIDELAYLLAAEKSAPAPARPKKDEEPAPRRPVTDALMRIATAGRFAGVHLVCIMQRGDADLLSGFVGNLLRARVLVGSTDQTAEAMAHGASSMNLWRELMGADGWEPDGMERALRPPGRAFVSGLAPRLPGLVQLYRFDSDSRFMPWTEYRARGGDAPDEPSPTSPPAGPSGHDSPGGPSSPPLSLVPDDVRTPDYADHARGAGAASESGDRPPSAPRLRVV